MNVVVDTSVWVDFFRGMPVPALEEALKEARVYITPVVVAELISGIKSKKEEQALLDVLTNLPLTDNSLEHWIEVGKLRQRCLKKGIALSTPDAHIAQSSYATSGLLMTKDKIFSKIARIAGIKVI